MSSVKNYNEIAISVLEKVGGKDNISGLTHCVTRLRFNLKDMGLADQDVIKEIDGVAGVKLQNGQFQVIIGQNVGLVYSELIRLTI